MSIEPPGGQQALLQVYHTASYPLTKGGFFKCFQHCRYPVSVLLYFFYSQAHTVMGNALVNGKLVGEGGFDPESFVGAAFVEFLYFTQAFDDSGKHAVKFGDFAFCFGLVRKLRLYLPFEKIPKGGITHANYRF
jgi:hypothetical protein